MKKIYKYLLLLSVLTIIFFSSCNDDDKNSDEITGIALNEYRIEVNTTESFDLIATVKPDNVSNKSIVWKSANPEIATVDSHGKVTGVQRGETKVTAAAGSKSATCVVNVKNTDKSVTIYSSGGHINETAKVWQNDKLLFNFSDAQVANSIYVEKNNIYAAGGSLNGQAKVWKNGILLYNLNDGEFANSIFVINGDVFVTGRGIVNGKSIAKVWKNGSLLYDLPSGVDAYSLVVYNNDVYVGGKGLNSGKVWKNGTLLYDLPESIIAYSIFALGSDIYIGGGVRVNNKTIGRIWKNGTTLYDLPETVSSIYVVGTDIYSTNGLGVYKNDVQLYNLLGKNPNSIFVLDGDVYVGGGTNNTSGLIWKNGSLLYTMPNSNTSITSIFVKKS